MISLIIAIGLVSASPVATAPKAKIVNAQKASKAKASKAEVRAVINALNAIDLSL